MGNTFKLDTILPLEEFCDNTPRVYCSKCCNYFALGQGMIADESIWQTSLKHLELCEGDRSVTLKKVRDWWLQCRLKEIEQAGEAADMVLIVRDELK